MKNISRRQALKTAALAGTALALLPGAVAEETKPALVNTTPEPFSLPPLPYDYDALEPFIDAQTMQIHHDRHHAAYVANLNQAWQKMAWSGPQPDLNHLESHWLSDSTFLAGNPAIRNNGGGHFNHSLFWQMMKKNGGGEPSAELSRAIDASFGNFNAFKEAFTKAALGQFGSGWAWLVMDGRQLKIAATANQDTPLAAGQIPLLGVDVWEHAYYLKYQNKRADYVKAWFNVVNWDFAAERYARLSK